MINLQLEEVRRLTGPNLLWDKPGGIVDLLIEGIDTAAVLSGMQTWTQRLLAEFGWTEQSSAYRIHALGMSFAISAPMDQLYSACDLLELSWDCCAAELLEQAQPDWKTRLIALRGEAEQEKNLALLALASTAKSQGVSCLLDDDEVSLGLGLSAKVWPVDDLPELSSLDWTQFSDIPRAFVTGTNGKSTSVRLASQIAKAAGICAGVTSTDFIRVGEHIIDHGDYSGPGGARMLLRDTRCEMAFLEVARGGILRRGLPVDKVDAALITNVAADHLGQYGINTVEELACTKFVVAKALDKNAVLVLNADNELVVAQAQQLSNTLCWFSTDEFNPLVQQHIAAGERVVFVRDGQIVYQHKQKSELISAITDIPMTFNGAAVHNVQNALGVVGLCKALALSNEAIAQGLREFGSNAEDNPGRGNTYQINGCQVIVDFAHNEHGVRALVEMASQLPANKRITMFGHAGDRRDQEIADLTSAIRDLNADLYIPAEIEKYLRGRSANELPSMMKTQLMTQGVPEHKISIASSPLAGAKFAISKAEPGDVLLLFVLDQRQEVHEWLSSLV